MSILFSAEGLFGVVGLQDLAARREERLSSLKKVKKYSSRNRLRRDMLTLNPAYEVFVSGSKCGSEKFFFRRVCHRDVGMKAQGAGEFARHFRSDGHWFRDVTYRVHMGLPVLNRLMEPMVLSANQLADFNARAFVDLAEGFPFPEDRVPKHAQVTSRVPFMTLVSSFCDLLSSGGDYTLLRRLWGHFRATLETQAPQYALGWSRSETVVGSVIYICIFCRLLGGAVMILLLCVLVFFVSGPCAAGLAFDTKEHCEL